MRDSASGTVRQYLNWVEVSLLIALALLFGACGSASEPDVRANQATISGGEAVVPGAWPMIVWLDNGCTGLLVAEDVVVFAAHCGANVSSVWQGDTLDISIDDEAGVARAATGPNVREVRTLGCSTHPAFELGTATDLAFCKLEWALIAEREIIRPLLGCGRARFGAGSTATLVGFGRSSAEDPPGVKRALRAPVISTSPSFQIGDQVRGSCAGDSGSPAFVRFDDGGAGEWAVAGILSGGIAGEACGVGYYVDLAVSLPWLELESGADVSPCFDERGAWAPSAACTKPAIDEAGLVSAEFEEPSAACGPSYWDLEARARERTPAGGCAIGAPHVGWSAHWLVLLAVALLSKARKRSRAVRDINRTLRRRFLRRTT